MQMRSSVRGPMALLCAAAFGCAAEVPDPSDLSTFAERQNATLSGVAGSTSTCDAGAHDSGTPSPAACTAGFTSTLATSNGWTGKILPAAYGTVKLTLQARPGAASLDGLFALSVDPMTAFSNGQALVRFAPNGMIDVRDGGAYASDVAFPYAANTWYTVAVELDLATQTYDVHVAKCGEPLVTLISGAQFRSDAPPTQVLSAISAWSAGAGSVEVADIAWTWSGTAPPTLAPPSPPPSGASVPSASVPSATTTGITAEWCPRWSELKKSTTGRTITTPGTVIEYEEINGQLDIRAPDVSVRCARITQVSDPYDNGLIHCRSSNGCTGGLLVEDTFVSGADPNRRYGALLTCVSDECSVRRSHVVRGCDTSKFEGGMVRDSFWDDQSGGELNFPNQRSPAYWDYCPDAAAHGDAQQVHGNMPAPAWWYGNRIEGPWRYATSAFIFGGGDHRDITIDSNYIQGGGYTIYLHNTSPPPSWVRVTNNTFATDSWIQKPPDSWEGNVFNITGSIGCHEMKKDGQWTNRLTEPDVTRGNDTIVDETYGAQSSAKNIGACNASIANASERARADNGQYPRSPWTGISPMPVWDVSGMTASTTSCTKGSTACKGIDLSANASGNGDTVSPPFTTGSPRWRYNCGGSAANRAGLHPQGADLWYWQAACNGKTSCSIADACDFSAEPAGTYRIRMYSESGPGSGVRASDHAEIIFTVG